MLKSLPQDLLRGKLIVDVLSVKNHPKQAMLETLPADCDILCTHPMFGPESGTCACVTTLLLVASCVLLGGRCSVAFEPTDGWAPVCVLTDSHSSSRRRRHIPQHTHA